MIGAHEPGAVRHGRDGAASHGSDRARRTPRVDGYAEGCQHGDVDPPFAGRSTIWFDPHMGQTAIRPNWRLMGCKEAVMIGTRIAGFTIRLLHPAFNIAALWSVTAGLIGHSQGGQQDDRQQFQPRRR